MIGDFFTLSYRNLRKRRVRSLLTLFGILIAITTIFVLISISLGLEKAVEEQFRLLGTDKIFIQPRGQIAGPGTGGAAMLTKKDVDVVKKVNGIKDVSYWAAASAKVKHEDEVRFINAVGIDLESSDLFIETGSYEADEGRVLKKGDAKDVMIGSQYKNKNFIKKQVRIGDTLLINDVPFEVRGILEPIGNPPDDRLIYMPEDEFRILFGIRDRIDFIVAQIEPTQDIKIIAQRIEKELRESRGVSKRSIDFSILTPEEILESFGTVLNIVTAFLIGIAALSLLVGGIGIANTMYTSVLERTKEIGVMKAIGARNQDIITIFLIESALLGLVGGGIGVILGIVISKSIEYYAITQLNTKLLQAALPPVLVVGCLFFSSFIGALSGVWPAYRATKIKPVEALRYE